MEAHLNKLPADLSAQLIHQTVAEHCGLRGAQFERYSAHLGYHEFLEVRNWLKTKIFQEFVRRNGESELGSTQFVSEAAASLDTAHGQQLAKILAVRKADIAEGTFDAYFRKLDGALVDFDWDARMILGSDKIANIRKPIVNLHLLTTTHDKGNGSNDSKRHTQLQLNADQLKMLISALEQAC